MFEFEHVIFVAFETVLKPQKCVTRLIRGVHENFVTIVGIELHMELS